MHGWMDKILQVNLSNSKIKQFSTQPYIERFLGGRGIASRLYWETVAPEISPPICEICQSAEATRHWPEDYVLSHLELCPTCQQLLSENPLTYVIDLICETDRVKLADIVAEAAREELCERCYALRAEGTKLLKLDRWSKAR